MKRLVNRLFPSVVAIVLATAVPVPAFARPQIASSVLPEAPSSQNPASSTSKQSSSSTQQTPALPAQNSATPTQPDQKTSEEQLKTEEKQRMLGIMPAFNSVESGQAVPLRPGQKFHLWFRSAVDPFTFAAAGIDAGIEQAENSYPEYGQGFVGYAKRYGAAYADNVDGNFWGNAVLPVILHQDPRYFRLGHGSIKGRIWYATISTVRCKGDNGKWQPSYSNIGGNLIGGAIANAYYPAADRGFGLTMERGFTVTAEGAFGAFAYEFYPDLIQYWRRHHQKGANPAANSATPSAPATQP